jgi:hypothetical protein
MMPVGGVVCPQNGKILMVGGLLFWFRISA